MKKAETKESKSSAVKSSLILTSPRITEKSTTLAETNKYTFNVAVSTNKNEIKKEVKKLYGVKPLDVNIIAIAPKSVFVRGRHGVKKAGKKAVITVKKGDSLPLA
ncbi:50S ribosomal protein L23 [Candidatus Nomurabacteria bacterium RIFCSPHIGHO2_02_FULL_38_15]|uniref:Large ribosomal subunit protein uL23 n=1 Tax=Candidatus Nomurabacteria bacterium RIFCSPHIGHO2_02_FULL_38_15 TaxID=1801752 RepID=A0A1F6VS33_9BACT|nr:MAG: 50S ribosomal protein L23 [Candidatus Nomurabacteria bacterium RIFCSPHIGHO2_02_FULL_38_15]